MPRSCQTNRIFKLGERGSGLCYGGQVQDFHNLRQKCLDEGRLFEDPEFPAEHCSLSTSQNYEWKRPHDLTDQPELFIEGVSRFDVKQGGLGDCWFLAAVATLTLNKEVFYGVVPEDQGDNYAGIFHFRFWQYGHWVDIVVDDRLPTENGRLVFMHSEEGNEFWSALLEKAYAKIHGSYQGLEGGITSDAMEDFTGGLTEMYNLTTAPANLLTVMLKASQRGSFMGCHISASNPDVIEGRCANGLVEGHAYSVTGINTTVESGSIHLIRVRNPWGNETEWNGAWSDQSPQWQSITPEEKEELGLTFEHDGEFWMSYEDFITNFTGLEITHLSPDHMVGEDMTECVQYRWEKNIFEGAWVRGSTAGGCPSHLNSFWHNPQYRITLTEVDDDDDDNLCTVVVALMQNNRRSQWETQYKCIPIGFKVYHLEDPDSAPRPLDLNFFQSSTAEDSHENMYLCRRQVSHRLKLPPGTYCIVPSTYSPNQEAKFVLRVFSEKPSEMEENDEEIGIPEEEEVQPEEEEEEEEESESIQEFFERIAGEDLEVDWQKLQEILNFELKKEFDIEGITKSLCQNMIAMIDTTQSGRLDLKEFLRLWRIIKVWKNVFKQCDADNSGYLCAFESRQALKSAGYCLTNSICNTLMYFYGDEEGKMSLNDFLTCSVRLRTTMEIFQEKDPDKTRSATFTLEEWIKYSVCA